MSCVSVGRKTTLRIRTSSTTNKYIWYTDWMPGATGYRAVKFLVRFESIGDGDGTLVVQPAVQLADNPVYGLLSPETIGNATCSETDDALPLIDLSTLQAHFQCRFGLAYKVASANTSKEDDVSVQLGLENQGRALPSKSFTLAIPADIKVICPVSEWLPAQMVGSISLQFLGQSTMGNVECRTVYQLADVDPANPGSWTSPGGWLNVGDFDGEHTTTVGDNMWIRIGAEFQSDSEGDPAAAIVTVVPSFRK